MIHHLLAVIAASIKKDVGVPIGPPPQFTSIPYSVMVGTSVPKGADLLVPSDASIAWYGGESISSDGTKVLIQSQTKRADGEYISTLSVYAPDSGILQYTDSNSTLEVMFNSGWTTGISLNRSMSSISNAGCFLGIDYETGICYLIDPIANTKTAYDYIGENYYPSWDYLGIISSNSAFVLSDVQAPSGDYVPYLYTVATGARQLLPLGVGSVGGYPLGVSNNNTHAIGVVYDTEKTYSLIWNLVSNTIVRKLTEPYVELQEISADGTKAFGVQTYGDEGVGRLFAIYDLVSGVELNRVEFPEAPDERLQACISADFNTVYYALSEYTVLWKYSVNTNTHSSTSTPFELYSNTYPSRSLLYASVDGSELFYREKSSQNSPTSYLKSTSGFSQSILASGQPTLGAGVYNENHIALSGLSGDAALITHVEIDYRYRTSYLFKEYQLNELQSAQIIPAAPPLLDDIYLLSPYVKCSAFLNAAQDAVIGQRFTTYYFDTISRTWGTLSASTTDANNYIDSVGVYGVSIPITDSFSQGRWICSNNIGALDTTNNVVWGSITDPYFYFIQTSSSGDLLMATGTVVGIVSTLKKVSGELVETLGSPVNYSEILPVNGSDHLNFYSGGTLIWETYSITCTNPIISYGGSCVGYSGTRIRSMADPGTEINLGNPPGGIMVALADDMSRVLVKYADKYTLFNIIGGIAEEVVVILPSPATYTQITYDSTLSKLGFSGPDIVSKIYSDETGVVELEGSNNILYIRDAVICYTVKAERLYTDNDLMLQDFSANVRSTPFGTPINWIHTPSSGTDLEVTDMRGLEKCVRLSCSTHNANNVVFSLYDTTLLGANKYSEYLTPFQQSLSGHQIVRKDLPGIIVGSVKFDSSTTAASSCLVQMLPINIGKLSLLPSAAITNASFAKTKIVFKYNTSEADDNTDLSINQSISLGGISFDSSTLYSPFAAISVYNLRPGLGHSLTVYVQNTLVLLCSVPLYSWSGTLIDITIEAAPNTESLSFSQAPSWTALVTGSVIRSGYAPINLNTSISCVATSNRAVHPIVAITSSKTPHVTRMEAYFDRIVPLQETITIAADVMKVSPAEPQGYYSPKWAPKKEPSIPANYLTTDLGVLKLTSVNPTDINTSYITLNFGDAYEITSGKGCHQQLISPSEVMLTPVTIQRVPIETSVNAPNGFAYCAPTWLKTNRGYTTDPDRFLIDSSGITLTMERKEASGALLYRIGTGLLAILTGTGDYVIQLHEHFIYGKVPYNKFIKLQIWGDDVNWEDPASGVPEGCQKYFQGTNKTKAYYFIGVGYADSYVGPYTWDTWITQESRIIETPFMVPAYYGRSGTSDKYLWWGMVNKGSTSDTVSHIDNWILSTVHPPVVSYT